MLGLKANQQVTKQTFFSLIESYARRQRFRCMANTLLAEKDNVLEDLGYERHSIIVALNLPLRRDAAKYLEQNHRV